MARQKRSCSAGTGGRGQRTGSSAKARPDGIAAIHRGTAARHPIETGQGGGGQGCGFRMEQKLSECCTGKELPPGRNPEHTSPAEVRPDGIAAMHRDRVLQRNRDEDFAAKAAKICPEKPKQAFLHGKRTSVRPKNTVHAISAEAKQAEVAGDAIPRRTGKGIQRHNTPPELGKGPRTMGALKCVRPVRAGAAAGSRRLRRSHSIPPAAGPSCAAPACP